MKTSVITPEEMDKIRDDAPASSELIPDDEEDEDDDKINPKMEKAITIMGIAAAVIIAIIALYLLGSFLGWFHFGSSSSSKKEETKTSTKAEETITVQDLTGMTEDEAKAALEKAGLKYELSGKESSDTVKEGLVVRQTPKAKKKAAEGTKVKVTLSSGKGQDEVDVPNVVGKTLSQAKTALQGAGLEVSVEYKVDDNIPQGQVISQTPSSGKLNEGDTVTIVVSQGQETVTVPSVVNSTQSSAEAAIKANNLTVGSISQAYSDTVAAGYVISQSPEAGRTVNKNTSVDLVVSLGKQPEEKPAETPEKNDNPSTDTPSTETQSPATDTTPTP